MNKMKQRKGNFYILVSSFGMMICLLFASTVFVQAAEEEKRVLFISSYSGSFLSVLDQIRGLQSVFMNEDVDLEIEYMDTKRFTADENIKNFYTSLKSKIENSPDYDVIIVGDDAALKFALDYQGELFREILIIFFGINDNARAEKAAANPFIAGSIKEASYVENIENVLQNEPKKQRKRSLLWKLI